MAHRFAPHGQDNFTAPIDSLASDTKKIAGLVSGNNPPGSRGLRDLWAARLRPFWRLHLPLYRALSRRFLDLGENFLAAEVADEAFSFFGDDIPLILTRALATARGGAPLAARELLNSKESILEGAHEAKSLLARTNKDLWKSSGDASFLEASFDLYHADFLTNTTDRAFPGVNAASMALFLGRIDTARRIASEVVDILSSSGKPPNYWDDVTLAECLLVAGRIEEARSSYARAASSGDIPAAHLSTTRAQTRLLLTASGLDAHAFDHCFPLPDVIIFSGHRIDAPGRSRPRFPAEREAAVKDQIRLLLDQLGGGIGFAAAANGGDILFMECLQETGLESFIHLPLPEEEFIAASVDGASGQDWTDRYRRVTAAATELTFSRDLPASPGTFDYGNRLLLGSALLRARQLGSKLHFVTVWDGEPGNEGGTGSFVRMARAAGCEIHVIDPAGNPPASLPPPLPAPSSPAGLLTILAVRTISRSDEEIVAAAILDHPPRNCLSRDGLIELVFESLSAAVLAARSIRSGLGPASNMGLHSAPMALSTHPVTNQPVLDGFHGTCARQLANFPTPGIICASQAVAALLALEPGEMPPVEFLGSRDFSASGRREPVFRLIA